MKKCNEVMTKNPVCCLPDDMVAKVAQLMQSENIGSIPVIENEQTQKLVGIVTDRDLALKISSQRARCQIHESGGGDDAPGSDLPG